MPKAAKIVEGDFAVVGYRIEAESVRRDVIVEVVPYNRGFVQCD